MEEKIQLYILFIESVFEKLCTNVQRMEIEEWVKNDISIAQITKAYGLMMRKCEKKSFPYMSTIIKNWIENKKEEQETEERRKEQAKLNQGIVKLF